MRDGLLQYNRWQKIKKLEPLSSYNIEYLDKCVMKKDKKLNNFFCFQEQMIQ